MSQESRTTVVQETESGVRLDVLVARVTGASRQRVRELLRHGAVQVGGRSASERDKGLLLEAGTAVVVTALDLESVVPSTSDPAVLAEGEGWLATDKPAGVAVHPLRIDETDTMLQRVLALRPQIRGVGEGGRRSGVVHRLDVDTSGVQLFAYDQGVWEWLRAGFREHRVEKVYRALVAGEPTENGEIEFDLVVAAHRPARVVAAPAGRGGAKSRRCLTRWKVLETFDGYALVEVRPRTGFLHQVRVTFSTLGHPLLGDVAYGGDARRAGRHMLHASEIHFEGIDVASPDPEDFRKLCGRRP